MPEQAYSRPPLGVYELTRIELLRDLYVWAYERSTQEYLAIKRDLVEPDPLRLAWRGAIKQSVREVVRQPERAPVDVISECLSQHELGADRGNVEALVIEELRRLHDGVLACYGPRPSKLSEWQSRQRSA